MDREPPAGLDPAGIDAMTSRPGVVARLRELRDKVAEGPGQSPVRVRRAAASGAPVPAAAHDYAQKVRRHAYKVVDRDVESLRAAGWSDDEIFELTVALAMGEGMFRLEHAQRLVDEVRD